MLQSVQEEATGRSRLEQLRARGSVGACGRRVQQRHGIPDEPKWQASEQRERKLAERRAERSAQANRCAGLCVSNGSLDSRDSFPVDRLQSRLGEHELT